MGGNVLLMWTPPLEPTQVVADSDEEQTAYYGYIPLLSYAALFGSFQGGCAEYSYSWSVNGLTVNSLTTYTNVYSINTRRS